MNTGIQDAFNLAWKLALVIEGKAADALLDTYQQERLPIARKVLSETDQHTNIFFARNFAYRLLRDHVVIPLLNLAFVQRRLLWEASELGINYRTSTLSQASQGAPAKRPGMNQWQRRASRPGDRAPDGHCVRLPSRETTSLFREFRGTTSHLLVFDGLVHAEANYAQLTQTACRVKEVLGDEVKISLIVSQGGKGVNIDRDVSILLDPEHVLHARYGAASPSLYFIRPDGYIGFRCQPVQGKLLLDYLEQLFMKNKVEE